MVIRQLSTANSDIPPRGDRASHVAQLNLCRGDRAFFDLIGNMVVVGCCLVGRLGTFVLGLLAVPIIRRRRFPNNRYDRRLQVADSVRRVVLLSDGFLDRAGNMLDFGDRFRNLVDCNDGIVGRFLNFRHLDMDILGCASRLISQVLHFRSDEQKILTGVACTRQRTAGRHGRLCLQIALRHLLSRNQARGWWRFEMDVGTRRAKRALVPEGQIRSRFAPDRRLFGLSQRQEFDEIVRHTDTGNGSFS